jgi:hypothetical protein
MKILNLVLYSTSNNTEYYEEMQEINSEYYKKFNNNVITLYYKFSNIEEDYKLENDILHIKGDKESYVPGILEKTIKAFEYIIANYTIDNFDYIVRSNISTIINFDLLIKELEKHPIVYYGGGNVMNLQWNGGGINDNKWYGTLFASGTSLIFKPSAVKYIIDNKKLLRYEIVDDVAFGIFFREHRNDIICQEINQEKYLKMPCCFIDSNTLNLGLLKNLVKKDTIIFYRNSCFINNGNRKIDAVQMKYIVDILMNKI